MAHGQGYKIETRTTDTDTVFLYRIRNRTTKKYDESRAFSASEYGNNGKAKAAGKVWADKMAAQRLLSGHIASNTTLLATKDAIEFYHTDCINRELSPAGLKDRFRRLRDLPKFCPNMVAPDAPMQLYDWWTATKAQTKANGAPRATATVNAFLEDLRTFVKHLWTFRTDNGLQQEIDLGKLAMLPTHKIKQAIYTIPELKVMLESDHSFKIRAALMMYTGARVREVMRLRYHDVMEEEGIIVLRANKTRARGDAVRWAKLQPELIPFIEEWRALGHCYQGIDKDRETLLTGAEEQDYLFPITKQWALKSTLGLQLTNFLGHCGIPKNGRNSKSFRHTFGSMMTAAGEPSNLLKPTMGHLTDEMSENYSDQGILYAKQIREEKWDRGILRLTETPEKTKKVLKLSIVPRGTDLLTY